MGCDLHEEPQYLTCGACVGEAIAATLADDPDAFGTGEVSTTEELAERLGIDLD